jgi:hypothetical protein
MRSIKATTSRTVHNKKMDALEADVNRVFHERREREKAARCFTGQQQQQQTQTDAQHAAVRRVLFVVAADS